MANMRIRISPIRAIVFILVLAADLSAGQNCVAGSSRPNIVVLLADDQRPDTIRAFGNKHIRTPHLDRIAERGSIFPRAIVAIPICVASRAEILTGRDGLDNGQGDFGFSPKPEATSWASTFEAAGYQTCYVGKWHTRGRPSDYGYSRTQGLFGSGGGKFPLTHPQDWKGMDVTGYRGWLFQTDKREIFPEKGIGLTPDISADFADAAIRFIESQRNEPFFLHVNFTAPHDPLFFPSGFKDNYQPSALPLPPNFLPEHPFDHGNFDGRDEKLYHWPRTPAETRAGLSVYYAVIEHLDQQVGRVLKSLASTNQSRNTIVIYSSDHGLAMGSHGLRGKQNMYEHSIGVPLMMCGPGIPRGQICETQCYLRDLFPTTCALTGLEIPPSVQGRSLTPALEAPKAEVYDAVFAHFRDSQRMIRTADWKFVTYPQVDREQLFHLRDDPHELRNLIDSPEYAETAKRLRTRLREWRQSHQDPTLKR